MKTILEWLEEAKEQGYEWAEAAIRNYDPDYAIIKETKDLSAPLIKAFSWRKVQKASPIGLGFLKSLLLLYPLPQ